jgi:hypothetical protein
MGQPVAVYGHDVLASDWRSIITTPALAALVWFAFAIVQLFR